MLPPFSLGKAAVRTVTTSATSYTFVGQGRQVMLYASSALAFVACGGSAPAAKAASATPGTGSTALPPGAIMIFTRNPATDTKLSFVGQATTKVYVTEGDGA